MKKLKQLCLAITAVAVIASCKKNDLNTAQLDGGMLNVTNAVIGSPTLTLMSANGVVVSSNSINNFSSIVLPLASGEQNLKFGLPAVDATANAAAIPAAVYFTQSVTMDKTTNYSLFLTGTSTSTIESVLVKENYPRAYADSICGVRFINLSPGSNPISVNLKGNAAGSEASNLAFKTYSGFNKYVCKKATPVYTFEFRDAATGTLLTSANMVTPYFHNTTLCLRGKAGAYGVIQNNDF